MICFALVLLRFLSVLVVYRAQPEGYLFSAQRLVALLSVEGLVLRLVRTSTVGYSSCPDQQEPESIVTWLIARSLVTQASNDLWLAMAVMLSDFA